MNQIVNFEDLLRPISPDHPSGENLRYTEVYDQINEARRSDDLLEQGEWQTEPKASDWRLVNKLCCDALVERSKDIQIAFWLTEALVHQHGYGGLVAGLKLILKLIQEFWLTLYPQIEDGDLDFRAGSLMLLDEKLPAYIYQVAVCDPSCSRGFHYFQWKESRLVGFNQDLDKEQRKHREMLIEEGKVSAEDFTVAVNAGSADFYRSAVAHLARSREILIQLDELVTQKFASDPPGFRHLSEAIDACAHLAGRILKDKQKSEITPGEDLEAAGSDLVAQTAEPGTNSEGAGIGIEVLNDPLGKPQSVISDVTAQEKDAWKQVSDHLEKGRLKPALDQLLSAVVSAPSVREKNRYLLLVAKLCLRAERVDLAMPIVEELYGLIETLKLEQWEHPAWVADVVETLFRCLSANGESDSDRCKKLFNKLCMLNVTKAAAHRLTV